MRRGLVILLVVVAVFIFAGLFVYGSFVSAQHQLVSKDENVKSAWSQVDVQLQRRADLVPNLVATVKGFATHEETVFGDIANARAGLLNARDPQSKIEANGKLDSAFGRTEPDEEIQDLLKASVGLNLGLHYLSGAITYDPAVTAVPRPRARISVRAMSSIEGVAAIRSMR